MTFSLKILGSSSAMPTPKRFSTAQVLNVLERFFLIDCGEGTQIQLRRYKQPINKINHILISHLHGDHFLGIFGIISSLNLLDRKAPLHIYGPHKLHGLIKGYLATFDRGLNYELVFHALDYSGKQLLFEDDKVQVHSFPLRHRVPTCGFLFEEKARQRNLIKDKVQWYKVPLSRYQSLKEGKDYVNESGEVIANNTLTKDPIPSRSYAFVSDTSKANPIVPIIKGVDLLYHEATFTHDKKKRAKETGHSTAKQAAEIAQAAEVKKLIIGHFSNSYRELDPFLTEAKEVFENTELCFDGAGFELPAESR